MAKKENKRKEREDQLVRPGDGGHLKDVFAKKQRKGVDERDKERSKSSGSGTKTTVRGTSKSAGASSSMDTA